MAEIENWIEWRQRCALARCAESARHDLCGFAFDRFRYHLQKLQPSLVAPRADDAWHAFETYLALGRKRTTKAWKEWLFARGGDPPSLNCIQGGATLVMRDVVRNHLTSEYGPDWLLSLDAYTESYSGQDGSALSVEDLLPDPTDPGSNLEHEELQELADQLFPSICATLPPREQIALTIHQAGKALSHSSVTKAAQCSKSSLCYALHHAMKLLAEQLQNALPDETNQTRIKIAIILMEKNLKYSLKMLEIEHPDLFLYIKEEHNDE